MSRVPRLRCPVCCGPIRVDLYPSEHYDGDVIDGIFCEGGCGIGWDAFGDPLPEAPVDDPQLRA